MGLIQEYAVLVFLSPDCPIANAMAPSFGATGEYAQQHDIETLFDLPQKRADHTAGSEQPCPKLWAGWASYWIQITDGSIA